MDLVKAVSTLKLQAELFNSPQSSEVKRAVEAVEEIVPTRRPATRHTTLTPDELETALVKSAYALDVAQRSLDTTSETIKAIHAADYQMPLLTADLAAFEQKVKELKSEIATRHRDIIPLDLQAAHKAHEEAAADARDAFGYLMSELTVRFAVDPSNALLGHIHANGKYYAVRVNRTSDAGWVVTDKRAFFLTLPESHQELFNVSITTNTKEISRAEVNRWFEVEHVTGTLAGVERRPRTVQNLEGQGFFTVAPLPETDAPPAHALALDWSGDEAEC